MTGMTQTTDKAPEAVTSDLVALEGAWKHGTAYAYQKKCRCDDCRRGQGIRAREYRERNRERFAAQRRAEYAANPERFKKLTTERSNRHRGILARYKVLVGCSRCGFRASAVALHFHHRDPGAKEFNVSMGLGRAWRRIKAEVRKCDVLCANCHAIVEAEKW